MSISKIKSMKLYKNVNRIFNELKKLGKDKLKKLNIEDLTKFDQLHYNGTKAVDFAIKKIGINSKKRVLEIGSGIGGPSRYIAYKTKALVTALELQKDQNNKKGTHKGTQTGLVASLPRSLVASLLPV